MSLRVALTVVCATLTPFSLQADTFHVPADYATIQAAINASYHGDEVVIADGRYTGAGNYDLTFNGRLITVRSASGNPEDCIIDCEQQGRGFLFIETGETREAVVEGLTITNGYTATSNGGGIDISLGASPTIRNCIISKCRAASLGGGIAVRGQCAPLIEGCTFVGNIAIGSDQGAGGGGLCLFFLSPATVIDCVFVNNYSTYGGGINCGLSDASIINCAFFENDAYYSGGAVCADVADPHLINCTIVNNRAGAGAGGVAGNSFYLPSNPVLDNCILWDNSPSEIVIANGEATVRYSDVRGGWPGVGNIDADPGFAGPTLAGEVADFTLLPTSPCIDAGDNTALPDGITTDIAGQPRFVDRPETPDTGNGEAPLIDMGALEFQTCPGDLNGDHTVDQADLGLLLAAYNQDAGGDLDGDGDTDQADLGVLLAHFGEVCN